MENWILLHTHSIMAFILATTQFGMLLFLIRLRTSTQIRRWMIINYAASVIWQVDQTVRFSLHPSLHGTILYKIETVLIYSPALAILVLSYFQILYLFLHRPYEKERRNMIRIVVPVAVGLIAVNAWNEFFNNSNLLVFQGTSFVYGLLTNVWALIISIRKANFLRTIDAQAAKAHNWLVVVNMGFIVMCVVAVVAGFYSPVGYWTFFILIWLCNLTQIVVYINYSAVPASFQIKMAGFSFVTVVTFLTAVTLVFFPPLLPTEIEARAAQQEGLRRMFITIIGATLFVVAVLPRLLRRSLSRPLKNLLLGVKQVNAGDLKVQVPVGSPDEIGDLAHNFNQMTQSLKQADEQLRDYAEKLEQKVAERTAALKESLDTLQATQAQLIQAEKMASLGELTAGIAHEIQNPLNFVNNFSEVSKELLDEMKVALENGDAVEAKSIVVDLIQNLEKINHHGKRADAIVKGMLQHSRSSTNQKEPSDINALADEYLRLAYHGLRAKDNSFNASLETNYDETVPKMTIMPQDIGRVILNLVTNAFYAVNEKKKAAVTEAAKNVQESATYQPKVTVSTKNNEDTVTILVKDNGNGVPQKIIDKIFQPFFTTKPAGSGTGLGLSISYDIITNGHGGSLQVESQEGKGTEMIITLPVAKTVS